MKLLRCALAGSLFMLAALPAAGAEVTQDDLGRIVLVGSDTRGRLVSRRVIEADGSCQVTSTQYWGLSAVLKGVVAEERDAEGRTLKNTRERYDAQGRLVEQRSVTIEASGRVHGVLKVFTYDAQGQRTETSSPIER